MNHKLSNYFEGVVVIHAEGRKIDRFLSYIYKLKISILEIKYIDRQNVLIKIFNRDLDKVLKLKTSYDIKIEGYEGKLRLRELIRKYRFLFLSILLGYFFLILLSNIIFDVEVIHSNASIRNLIIDELAEHNIKRWHLKQNFDEIEKIKVSILSEYKDRLEWLEIENVGTRYIVKVEERKIKNAESNYIYQDIVSSRNAIITKVEAIAGEIVKHKNDYVKKGDIIISGTIMKGEEVSKLTKASGKIYGEVWYNIKVEHPLVYQNKIETGKKREVYKIIFLGKSLSLFDFHPLKSKVSQYSSIVANPLIPFEVVKDSQKEVIIEDVIYTDGEALIKAEEQAVKKMEDYLLEDEYIISRRKLKYYVKDQKLYLDIFFKVYESIGEPRVITE